MLDLTSKDKVPQELLEKILNIDNLCQKVGGVLASRQTIAVIVNDYLEKHSS